MAEQLDIIDEDGATGYRHRPTGFIGRVYHGNQCAGQCVTERPGVGTVARMLQSGWMLTLPGAEFQVCDPAGGYAPSRWIVGTQRDGITRVFRPHGRQLIVGASGSIAHPIQIKTGAASGTFAATIKVPAGLLYPGIRGNARARVRKTGTAGAAGFTLNLGTAGNSTDAVIATGSFAATSPREVILNPTFDVYDATTFVSEDVSLLSVDQAALSSDRTTNFNIASAMVLSVNYAANASDSIVLENISLHLEALF